jgi:predicted translin family RNA/ssDNA-binding protein
MMQEVYSKIVHHVYYDAMSMTVKHPVTYEIRKKTFHIDVIWDEVRGNVYAELHEY